MHSTSPSSQGSDHPVNYWGFGPRTSAVLAASGMVCTAFGLGADWLATSYVGLPLGAWLVAGAGVAAHVWAGGSMNPASLRRFFNARTTFARPLPAARTRFELEDTLSESAALQAGLGLARVGSTLQRATARIITRSSASTVTIGVDTTDAEFNAIVTAIGVFKPGGAEIDVVRADAGLVKEAPTDAKRYDALLRRSSEGEFFLFVPEIDGHPAAVEDWSRPGPLGYAACFPVRLDTSRVELGSPELHDASTCELVAALTTVIATLGRAPARLPSPNSLTAAIGGRSTLANFSGVLDGAIEHLADSLATYSHEPKNAKLAAVAARLLLAHYATRSSHGGKHNHLELAARAADLLNGEPEALLRLGAVQVASGHDAAALETFAKVCQDIRETNARCATDPMVYVMSESDLGQPDALTLGRIAAGVTLMYATVPQNTMTYMRDDTIEDLESTKRFAHDVDGMTLIQNLTERLCRTAQPTEMATTTASDGPAARPRKRRKAA